MQKASRTLQDATKNSVPTDNGKISKYNLRIRDQTRLTVDHTVNVHTERLLSLLPTLNLQMKAVRTIYPMDNRPIPDAKLEKIVGLSEPSAYRLGAQSYIGAKKRGELPPPPKRTLPGFKAKPDTEPENKTSEDSTDSEATEIYEPPKLPDETKSQPVQAKQIRGKLQIKKLTL